jgi:hypothetical protein
MMIRITFDSLPVGTMFIFGDEGLQKLEPVVKCGEVVNARSVDGDYWLFSDDDVISVLEGNLKKEEMIGA